MILALDAWRRLAERTVALLATRAELASVELARARGLWVRWLAMAVVLLVLLILALGVLTATLTLLLWEQLGWLTPAALTLLYAGAALGLLLRLMGEVRRAPAPLALTLSELAKDREAFFGAEAANPPASGRQEETR